MESTATRYLVCDYCGHVEPTPEHDDRAGAKCENCSMPLDTRTTFDTLDHAERYSQAVIDRDAGEGS